jgi:hypothetical protein
MAMELLCKLLLLEIELLHIATMKKNKKKKEKKLMCIATMRKKKKKKGKRRGKKRQLALRFRREVGSKKAICS